MSSILTDLEAALEAFMAAEDAYYGYDRSDIVLLARLLDEKMSTRSTLISRLLTDDTIRVLLDVAENAAAVRLSDICALMGDWYCESHSCDACGSVTDPCVLAPLRTMERALATLVKEADYDRA